MLYAQAASSTKRRLEAVYLMPRISPLQTAEAWSRHATQAAGIVDAISSAIQQDGTHNYIAHPTRRLLGAKRFPHESPTAVHLDDGSRPLHDMDGHSVVNANSSYTETTFPASSRASGGHNIPTASQKEVTQGRGCSLYGCTAENPSGMWTFPSAAPQRVHHPNVQGALPIVFAVAVPVLCVAMLVIMLSRMRRSSQTELPRPIATWVVEDGSDAITIRSLIPQAAMTVEQSPQLQRVVTPQPSQTEGVDSSLRDSVLSPRKALLAQRIDQLPSVTVTSQQVALLGLGQRKLATKLSSFIPADLEVTKLGVGVSCEGGSVDCAHSPTIKADVVVNTGDEKTMDGKEQRVHSRIPLMPPQCATSSCGATQNGSLGDTENPPESQLPARSFTAAASDCRPADRPLVGIRPTWLEDTCVICLEEWEAGARVTELPCGHRLHRDCALKWACKQISCSKTCPTCMQPMFSESDL